MTDSERPEKETKSEPHPCDVCSQDCFTECTLPDHWYRRKYNKELFDND